jgi:outer membrane protein assembly factor BamD
MPKWIDRFFAPHLSKNLILVFLMLFGMACSSAKIDPSDPGALYRDAEEEISSEHYQIALDKLRSIRNKFPYSNYAIDAQLRIADVYYLQELFLESAGSYESFRDLHPTHTKAPYAMYRIAKSYLNDAPSNIARDMTSAQKAMDAYLTFIKRYPDAKELLEAREDVAKLRELLAEKEFYIANFYLKRNYDDSAKPRFKKLIELYPDTNAAASAQEKLLEVESRAKPEGLAGDGKSDNHQR